ncbi:MAG: coxB [Rhodospirillales bacterium]|jgi:cytochrome c oxidase subunit 2|nr:coxB [Rhodospirillales bacterium]
MSNGISHLRTRCKAALAALLLLPFTVAPAFAQQTQQAVRGWPENWQMGMSKGVTPVAERLDSFHDMLLVIITGITIFVLALMLYTLFRFRKSANPVPSKVTHNTLVEILWTVVPVVILVVIAIPSFRLMYYMDKAKQPEMTVKITGHQWYWSYELPDQKVDEFASNMVPEDKLQPEHIRKLSVDYPLIVPVDTDITLLITGADVIHSWLLPQAGVQRHAVPGRTQETWMRITAPGTYYGQCNQICGTLHAYMPIEVHAVPKEQFQRWVQAIASSTAKDKLRDANEKVLGLNYKWMDAPKTADAASAR